jgi:hypothetical protein
LCGSQNKQPLFPYTALTEWFYITQTECVYCAVRNKTLNIIEVKFNVLRGLALKIGAFFVPEKADYFFRIKKSSEPTRNFKHYLNVAVMDYVFCHRFAISAGVRFSIYPVRAINFKASCNQ